MISAAIRCLAAESKERHEEQSFALHECAADATAVNFIAYASSHGNVPATLTISNDGLCAPRHPRLTKPVHQRSGWKLVRVDFLGVAAQFGVTLLIRRCRLRPQVTLSAARHCPWCAATGSRTR